MYEWIAGKISDWLYDILVRHIEAKLRKKHRESNWLNLARRISKRYDKNDYNI
jgi:hypothetical protein